MHRWSATESAENVTLKGGETQPSLEGDFIALTVADSGSGIAPDILPKVFDPFFTTKQGAKGTGLGLSQVHGFVHQSGGTVALNSELGRGTSVTLYLPLLTVPMTLPFARCHIIFTLMR